MGSGPKPVIRKTITGSRAAITDADRIRILHAAVVEPRTPESIAAELTLDRRDVAGVLGFCGWPKVARMKAQLDRLRAATPTSVATPEPAEQRAQRDQAAPTFEPATLAPSFPANVIGTPTADGRVLDDTYDLHRIRYLVTAGRNAGTNRAAQLAERLDAAARELDGIVTAIRAERVLTAERRNGRADQSDAKVIAAARTGSATKARSDYHRAFLTRHGISRDELAAWGRANGHQVGGQGMVPRSVLDAYEAANRD